MTPQDIITSARYVLNDTDATGYRQSNAELLGYVNEGMREVSAIRPDKFMVVGDHVCTPLQSEQNISGTIAQSVIRVIGIKNSSAMTVFDLDSMDRFFPSWKAATAAPAEQWSKYPADPLRFFIYPPAPAYPQTLSVFYVKIPTVLALNDTITEIPIGMQVPLIDYVVSRASAKDDEHSLSGRVVAAYSAFVEKIKGV